MINKLITYYHGGELEVPQRERVSTKFAMVDDDTFTTASHYERPCCLNFASHKRPGGGYQAVKNLRAPIKTQEEDLFRRSNLPEILDTEAIRKAFYPLKGVEGFHCAKVMVSKDKNLDPIDPFEVTVITVPAVVNPRPDQQELVEAKAQRIVDIAVRHGERVLILGAWGCGIFNNDPRMIAELFKELCDGKFDEVVFAIPGKESENYRVFEEVVL